MHYRLSDARMKSDSRTLSEHNTIFKYADYTTLVIPQHN